MRVTSISFLALTALAAVACGDPMGPDRDDQRFQVVMPGKADDYFSNVASEFEVTGRVAVTMSEEEYVDERLRDRIVSERISAVGVYLATYLTDKFRGVDINDDGEISDDEVFFRNEGYGNFKTMVRNRSVEVAAIEEDGDTYLAEFSIDVAGPRDLPERLVLAGAERQNGVGVSFELAMPAGATTDSGGRPLRSFDPATYDGELEQVPLVLSTLPEVDDAYPAYGDFLRDGRYEITLYFGHDYNAARSDLSGAREAYETLVQLGFQSPVASFDELGPNSGPFTKSVATIRGDTGRDCIDNEALNVVNDPLASVGTLKVYGLRSDAAENTLAWRAGADGVPGTVDDRRFSAMSEFDGVRGVGPRTIEKLRDAVAPACESAARWARIDVRIFHSDMYEGARAEQREQAKHEIIHRDVFFYNGHAGPYYGFYLDDGYDAYIDDADFAELPFRGDQKLFVAQGCQTYSQYADMLYANPALSEDNLDVITTINFSYAQGTMNLFRQLVQTDASGLHVPVTYNDLVGGLNAEYWNGELEVLYGVIGIDANPSLHPYATPGTIGDECDSHDECGASPHGSYCSGFSDGINRCVARTAAADGCPENTNYAYLADGQTVVGGVCWQMN